MRCQKEIKGIKMKMSFHFVNNENIMMVNSHFLEKLFFDKLSQQYNVIPSICGTQK